MHRNTFLLVGLLTVSAALVIGVNIGRNTASQPIQSSPSLPTTNNQQPTTSAPTPTPSIQLAVYTSTKCGITFSYPEGLSKLEADAGAVVFIDTQNPSQSIAVTCQKEIPRPPLPAEKIESLQVSNVTAKLYHDSSEKDGAVMDKLIFRHPNTKLDTFISGYGPAFETILATLTLL